MQLKTYLNKWLPLEINACPNFVLDQLGYEKIEQIAKQTIHQSYSYCTEEKFFEPAFNYCKVKGSAVADYKYRIVQTPFGEMVCSIRFVGGDLNKPAVFVMRQDFEINKPKQIKEIGEILKKEYALFKPKRIRWYSGKLEHKLIKNNAFINGDLIRIGEFLSKLKKQIPPINYGKIVLEKAKNSDWYDDYFQAYEKIYKVDADFIERAQALEKDVVQQLINKELFYEIQIENKLAGLIAANNESNRFLKGFVVYEEILFENFRRKQFATAAQFHLIEQLEASNNEMLYGTIHYENQASLKTALRCGRQIVGMFVFADI